MKKQRAFSLIEIMVVLGIISIILGLTTVYFFNYKSGAALKISANNVMAALNQARSFAITKQIEHEFVLDIVDHKYSVYAKPDDSTRQIVTPWTKLSDGVIFESNSENRITLPIDSNVMINKPVAVFNITGSAEKSASIYLKNSEGKYYTLTIVNTTGRVKIFNYKKINS